MADLRGNVGKRSRLWGATQKTNGVFRIQLQSGMPLEFGIVKLAHEMLHVDIWPKSHRSKEWCAGVKRLAAAGLLAEVF